MPDDDLTLTIYQSEGGVTAQLRCPAFVDREEHADVEDALTWAKRRLEGTDPFEEYQD